MGAAQHGRKEGLKFRAYYTGSDTLGEGYALCFDSNRGTAASEDFTRTVYVEKPNDTNVNAFAGVVADTDAKPGPCWVDLYEPGSPCRVYTNLSTTVNSTRMTVLSGQYYMSNAGFAGAGSALALQTLNRSGTEGTVLALLDAGQQSGGTEEITPPTTGATDTFIPEGVSFLLGSITIGTGDHIITLADGTYPGQRKLIICKGTYTTQDVVARITKHTASDPENRFLEAAGELDDLIWNGYEWSDVSVSTSDAS